MSENAKAKSEKYNEETYYKNFVKMVYDIAEENRENITGGQQKNG